MMMTSATLIPSQQQQQHQHQHQEQEHNLHHDDPHSKKRTRVTPTQLAILEDTFSVSATPDSKMRKHLAQKLQMPERSIQIWFQNRRAKVKMLQRRALLREEQDMARAKLYAEAAAAAANGIAANGVTPSHNGSTNGNISTPSPSTANSPSSYWYGPTSILSYPHHQTSKIPIQRSWSSDPAPSPLGRHLYQQQQQQQQQQQHHHHQFQHHPQHQSNLNLYPHQQNFHQPHQPSNLSSSSMYGNTTISNPPSSFDGVLIGESKESFYPGDMSPSPTPHPAGDLDTIKPFNDTTFINSVTTPTTSTMTTGVINVNAVTIGTWHRMKINQQDLLCCFQFSERTFEWHIRDSNYHFKMVISFDVVSSLDIAILDNGIFAQMDMELNEPPLFYMENMDDLTWTQCSDFTEGMQATCHLHHTLRGLASDLKQELLGMISMDQHLCQVIRFPMVPPTIDLPMGVAPAAPYVSSHDPTALTYDNDIASLDPSSLMSWRHQSLPIMDDLEWSHPSTNF